MALKEMLTAKGWTDEQISKAFADPGTLSVLDDLFGTVTSERDALKTRDEEWTRKLAEDYNPRITAAERKAMEAEKKAAALAEDVRLAKEYGYYPEESEADKKLREAGEAAAARGNQPPSFDPTKYVSMEDAAKIIDGEGEAIALAGDLAAEHRMLTGKDLFEYETQINGQTARGLRALRQEAKAKRIDLYQHVAQKFDYQGLRQKAAEARQKEHDDKIRAEAVETTRKELADTYGNPNLMRPTQSRQPFLPTPKTDGKQPWEIPANARRIARVQRGVEVQMQSERVQ
jgi:hypothetical protein